MPQLHNIDCLKLIATMADNSVDLVATDPPYFRVKANDWDNQWATEKDFLNWLESIVIEYRRILKPTGSLYLFAGPKMSSKVEAIIAKHFTVENHIVWAKTSGMHNRQCKANLRRFFNASERIIFASQKGFSEAKAQHQARAKACKPIIDYFRNALKSAGKTQADIDKAIGKHMAGHWFGYSQWCMPNKQQYATLQRLLKGHLTRSYNDVNSQYNTLINDGQNPVKRHFDVDGSEWFTDVWQCGPVQYYEGKHPCEKPAEIMEHIIRSSSREGDVVFDSFLGGGSTAIAALKLGRKFIGCELDKGYFENAQAKIKAALA